MTKSRIRAAGPMGLLMGLLMGLPMVLAACGPGVGGTGGAVDSADLAAFGASAQTVCGAAFADRLGCTPGQAAALPDGQLAGTQTSAYMDRQQGASLLVVFSGNSVQLSSTCGRLDFVGTWGQAAGNAQANDLRFFGTQMAPGQVSRSLASLTVQPAAGKALSAVLRDAAGQIVLGPIELVPTTLTQPAACGEGQASLPAGAEPQSCDLSLPNSPGVPFSPLQGNLHGSWPVQAYVARTADEWAALWARHDPLQVPPPERPVVDFARCMIVGLSLGWGTNGCSGVSITAVDETSDALRLSYRLNPPPPPDVFCTAQLVPLIALVRVRQSPKPVLLVPASN